MQPEENKHWILAYDSPLREEGRKNHYFCPEKALQKGLNE